MLSSKIQHPGNKLRSSEKVHSAAREAVSRVCYPEVQKRVHVALSVAPAAVRLGEGKKVRPEGVVPRNMVQVLRAAALQVEVRRLPAVQEANRTQAG